MAPSLSSIQRQTTSRETAKQKAILQTLKPEAGFCEMVNIYLSSRDIPQIFVNYVTSNFRALCNKLVAEKNYYPIEWYSSEIMRVNAMKKLAKMLHSFSVLLPHGTVPDGHKKWIRNQLNNADPKELLQSAQRNTKRTYEELRSKYDQNIQNEVEKRTKKPLGHLNNFPVNADKFHAGDFFDRKNEFKQVKEQISREEKIQKRLSAYLAAYTYTRNTLEAINSSVVDQLENYAF